jgi:hypothetical protein
MVNNNVTKKLKTVDMNYLLMLGGREVKQQWLCRQTACTNSSHKATKPTFSLQSPSYKNYEK